MGRVVSTAAVAAMVSSTAPVGLAAQAFRPDVTLGEVARVGGPEEANGLFHFSNARPRLVDSATVAYVEMDGVRRLVVANLLTGLGWKIEAGEGPLADVGPADLHPDVFITPTGIRVVVGTDRVVDFGTDGHPIGTASLPVALGVDGVHVHQLSGFLADGRPVLHQMTFEDMMTSGSRLSQQRLLAGSIEIALDSLLVDHWVGGRERQRQTRPPTHSARERVIAFSYPYSPVVHLVRDDLRAEVDVGWEVEAVHVDGSSRTWARLHRRRVEGEGYAWVVLRSTGEELMRVVPPRHFADAWGNSMLVEEWDPIDGMEWVLYRLQRHDAASGAASSHRPDAQL